MLPTFPTTPTCLFDTTVFIDHLRGQSKVATSLIAKAVSGEYPAAFSILTDAELWYGVKTPQDDKTHRILLSHLRRLPVIVPVARRAGELRRIYKIAIVDAIIAATTEYHNLPIYTRNLKHYEVIETIQVIGY